ncbi:MAG: helix-turn-helix domain-containing protein [Candidatus Competibacter sp.]|nr:helix-turn-helix domain-containing protein [Candidatus Competibacter sp.]MDG4604508.1 helix-turn-helix domain-containing protein [Candidatus Contendobacter sp.]
MTTNNLSNVSPLAYDIPSACIALGLSRQTVYDLMNSGKLRSYSEGRRRFISVQAITDYIVAREAESATFTPHTCNGLDKHRAQQATA